MTPEFSSTIFCCRLKKGSSAESSLRPSPPVSRLRMTSGASSTVTLAYNLPSDSTATRGPALHNPMQPTPLTWTSLRMPDSATSFSRASRTSAAPEDWQPAAMQTQTWWGNFFWASRSLWAILRSSSMVMDACLSGCAPAYRQARFFRVPSHPSPRRAPGRRSRGSAR